MRARGVVIGGGVCGAFSAYFLARRGWQVTCIDRGDAGAASLNNPGGLNPLHGAGIPGPLATFALESFAIHVAEQPAIAELSGLSTGFRRTWRLSMTLSNLAGAANRGVKATIDRYAAAGEGFVAEWLDGDALRSLEPRLASEVRGGLLTAGNARVDARQFVGALTAAGRSLGVVHVGADATGLVTQGARVTGVQTSNGAVDADAVVIATGAWSAAPAQWLDTPLPVEPIAGELLTVSVDGSDALPFDLSQHGEEVTGVYDAGMGIVMLGGTEARVGFDVTPTSGGEASIIERASRLIPSLRAAPVIERRVGLRPVTPDNLPILGRAPGWDNVFIAMGGGRKGMLLAAGMGHATADWATDESTLLSVDALAPGRFATATATE